MARLKLELINPQGVLFEGDVKSVMLPGAEGDMTILPGHLRLVTLVNPGMIEAVDADGSDVRVFVSQVLAEITENSVTVLAERAVMDTDLSPDDIDEEIVRIQLLLETVEEETTRTKARTMILRLEHVKMSRRN